MEAAARLAGNPNAPLEGDTLLHSGERPPTGDRGLQNRRKKEERSRPKKEEKEARRSETPNNFLCAAVIRWKGQGKNVIISPRSWGLGGKVTAFCESTQTDGWEMN